MIEGNWMEKNPDERVRMPERRYSRQLRQRNMSLDLMTVEIAVKRHGGENRHRVRITSQRMRSRDRTIGNERGIIRNSEKILTDFVEVEFDRFFLLLFSFVDDRSVVDGGAFE